MSGAPVWIPAPARGAGTLASAIEVRFCEGPAGLERALTEPDRVAVIGGLPEFESAARAVGMTGSVLAVCGDEPLRIAAEREGRLRGLYRLRSVFDAVGVPAGDGSLDAVVLAAPAATSRTRGRLLGEVGRVLRSGGRLVVVEGAPEGRASPPGLAAAVA